MWDVLLFMHVVISLLLITFILLQKSSSDGLSGISNSNNMGVVSARTAADFMTKTTIALTILFFINSLILANLSSKKSSTIFNTIESSTEVTPENNKNQDNTTVPIAK